MAEARSTGDGELRLHLLVLRCQTGDERAFAQLMGRFDARILRYLRGFVADAAEDVQQEVWLAVYRGIAALANPRAFRVWLFRTARHRALDFLRRQKREWDVIVDTPFETLDAAEPTVGEPDAGVVAAMLDALDTLPPAHREICLLRYRDELSYAEIALVVGCSVGTVRSRLHYAKHRLRESMAQDR